ncbi:(2Fe-2S) ferredoxin domain-containing protein [Prolixibacteraceae bacterium JC049]|nr:(2Fe-2S) ferredoxin domain-containing protein [Prolixibacteraceae bacterium JC049]
MEKIRIVICLGSSCFSRGNGKVLPIIKRYISENYLDERVDFRGELCSGNCKGDPHIRINGEFIYGVNESNIKSILDKYFLTAKVS